MFTKNRQNKCFSKYLFSSGKGEIHSYMVAILATSLTPFPMSILYTPHCGIFVYCACTGGSGYQIARRELTLVGWLFRPPEQKCACCVN